jgi:hypothetical protein
MAESDLRDAVVAAAEAWYDEEVDPDGSTPSPGVIALTHAVRALREATELTRGAHGRSDPVRGSIPRRSTP